MHGAGARNKFINTDGYYVAMAKRTISQRTADNIGMAIVTGDFEKKRCEGILKHLPPNETWLDINVNEVNKTLKNAGFKDVKVSQRKKEEPVICRK